MRREHLLRCSAHKRRDCNELRKARRGESACQRPLVRPGRRPISALEQQALMINLLMKRPEQPLKRDSGDG